MVVVKMPGGDVEYVDANELLWMREAFDHEFTDAVMLRIGGSARIYSIESLQELAAKFAEAGAAIERFTPPDGVIDMLVSTERVREVEPPNPTIYHEAAGSVLKFATAVKLAVRETVAEAQVILAKATKAAPQPAAAMAVGAAALGGAVIGAAVGAIAAAAITEANVPEAED